MLPQISPHGLQLILEIPQVVHDGETRAFSISKTGHHLTQRPTSGCSHLQAWPIKSGFGKVSANAVQFGRAQFGSQSGCYLSGHLLYQNPTPASVHHWRLGK